MAKFGLLNIFCSTVTTFSIGEWNMNKNCIASRFGNRDKFVATWRLNFSVISRADGKAKSISKPKTVIWVLKIIEIIPIVIRL